MATETARIVIAKWCHVMFCLISASLSNGNASSLPHCPSLDFREISFQILTHPYYTTKTYWECFCIYNMYSANSFLIPSGATKLHEPKVRVNQQRLYCIQRDLQSESSETMHTASLQLAKVLKIGQFLVCDCMSVCMNTCRCFDNCQSGDCWGLGELTFTHWDSVEDKSWHLSLTF